MKNKLILGTVQFGLNYGINNNAGKPSDDEIEKILLTAYSNNVLFLDTAEAYGDSQKKIGQFHLKHPEKKFNVITKFKENLNFTNIRQHVINDLQELNLEKLYAYFFHNLSDLQKHLNNIDDLLILKEKGLINKIGISLYTNDEIEEVLKNYKFIEIIQIPFNLFDNLNQRETFLKKIKKARIEVHTRSAFLQGLFFKKKIPDKLSVLQSYKILIDALCKNYFLSISELALNYCLSQSLIDKVLIGVDSEKQLIENINNINKLDPEIIIRLNNIDVKEKELLNPANW